MEFVTSPWKNPRTLEKLADADDDLNRVLRDGLSAAGAEAALECVTACVVELLGDKTVHLKPGALKEGPRKVVVGFWVLCDVMPEMDRQRYIWTREKRPGLRSFYQVQLITQARSRSCFC